MIRETKKQAETRGYILQLTVDSFLNLKIKR